jgi:hypothetical protein
VNGVVKAVDPATNTITVNDRTYDVAPDANIAIDNKPGALTGLPPGAIVGLTVRADWQTVGRIQAHGPSVFGPVKAVDAARNTLTVDDATFLVAKDTVVAINGKPGQLQALPVGAAVHVNLRVDQQTVSLVQTKAP